MVGYVSRGYVYEFLIGKELLGEYHQDESAKLNREIYKITIKGEIFGVQV